MLGVHASAQAIIHFGKIARKHNLSNVCFESLSRIHTIPSVPVVDCFQKIRQQVKCYHQMATATGMGKNELQGVSATASQTIVFFYFFLYRIPVLVCFPFFVALLGRF